MADQTEGENKRSLADCIEPSDPFELGRYRVHQLYNETPIVSHPVSSSRASEQKSDSR